MISIDRLQYELTIASEEAKMLNDLIGSIPMEQAAHDQNRHATKIIQSALKNAYDAILEMEKFKKQKPPAN
jgi:hypothetical protein